MSASAHTSSRPPHSHASISTAGHSASTSASRTGKTSIAASGSFFSGSDLSEAEPSDDEEERPAKRANNTHTSPTRQASLKIAGSSGGAGTAKKNGVPATERKVRQPLPRRGRKLGPDAAAYKPQGGESDGSDDEADAPVSGRRKKPVRTKKRGAKRAREEGGDDLTQDAEKDKRRPKRLRGQAKEKVVAGSKDA